MCNTKLLLTLPRLVVIWEPRGVKRVWKNYPVGIYRYYSAYWEPQSRFCDNAFDMNDPEFNWDNQNYNSFGWIFRKSALLSNVHKCTDSIRFIYPDRYGTTPQYHLRSHPRAGSLLGCLCNTLVTHINASPGGRNIPLGSNGTAKVKGSMNIMSVAGFILCGIWSLLFVVSEKNRWDFFGSLVFALNTFKYYFTVRMDTSMRVAFPNLS